MQRRNWRHENWKNSRENERQPQQQQQQQERHPSPETWRKPVEQPNPSSPDGLRYGKAASAVELAQAFSRSLSHPKADDRHPMQRSVTGRNQMPFSRLMNPTPRQINGYWFFCGLMGTWAAVWYGFYLWYFPYLMTMLVLYLWVLCKCRYLTFSEISGRWLACNIDKACSLWQMGCIFSFIHPICCFFFLFGFYLSASEWRFGLSSFKKCHWPIKLKIKAFVALGSYYLHSWYEELIFLITIYLVIFMLLGFYVGWAIMGIWRW